MVLERIRFSSIRNPMGAETGGDWFWTHIFPVVRRVPCMKQLVATAHFKIKAIISSINLYAYYIISIAVPCCAIKAIIIYISIFNI